MILYHIIARNYLKLKKTTKNILNLNNLYACCTFLLLLKIYSSYKIKLQFG